MSLRYRNPVVQKSVTSSNPINLVLPTTDVPFVISIAGKSGTVTLADVLPSQTNQAGKVLGTNGTITSWVTGGGTAAWGSLTGNLSSQTDLQAALNAKQVTLVSGTNIKTVNGTTLLGSGDLVVAGGDTYLDSANIFTATNTFPRINITKATASGIVFQIKNSHNYGHWNWTVDESYVNDDGRVDSVLHYGYNQNGGGGRLNASEASFHYAFESHYQAYPGANPQFEIIWQTVAANGDTTRQFGMNIIKATGHSSAYWRTGGMQFFPDGSGQDPYLAFGEGSMGVFGPTSSTLDVAVSGNEAGWLRVTAQTNGEVNVTSYGDAPMTFSADSYSFVSRNTTSAGVISLTPGTNGGVVITTLAGSGDRPIGVNSNGKIITLSGADAGSIHYTALGDGGTINPQFRFADNNWRWFRDDLNESGNQYSLITRGGGSGDRKFLWQNGTVDKLYFIIGDVGGTTGNKAAFSFTPGISQSGSASYTGMLMNVTHTSIGSGTNKLLDLQISATSVFTVNSDGSLKIVDGNQALGKVLTSDANGKANWAALDTPDISINVQTASYTIALSDRNKLVAMDVATANNLTVPPNSSVAFPIGFQTTVSNRGVGQVTFVPGSSVTINSAGGALKLRVQYSAATLIKTGTNTWLLIGDISV